MRINSRSQGFLADACEVPTVNRASMLVRTTEKAHWYSQYTVSNDLIVSLSALCASLAIEAEFTARTATSAQTKHRPLLEPYSGLQRFSPRTFICYLFSL